MIDNGETTSLKAALNIKMRNVENKEDICFSDGKTIYSYNEFCKLAEQDHSNKWTPLETGFHKMIKEGNSRAEGDSYEQFPIYFYCHADGSRIVISKEGKITPYFS